VGERSSQHEWTLIIYRVHPVVVVIIIDDVISLAGTLLLALLAVFVAIGVRLNYDYIPNLVSIESARERHYDYIIIGSGTSGSVLAYELSTQSNYTVLLIEAGGIFNGLSIVPIASTMMQVNCDGICEEIQIENAERIN
jgi:FlaA1/EpsC-like NDP-sugar epimerase